MMYYNDEDNTRLKVACVACVVTSLVANTSSSKLLQRGSRSSLVAAWWNL